LINGKERIQQAFAVRATMKRRNVIKSFALIAGMALACVQAQGQVQRPIPFPPPGPAQGLPAPHSRQPFPQQAVQRSSATDIARYLAGMPVPPASPLNRLTADPRWIAYSNAMNAAFSRLEQRQLTSMRTWQAQFLAPATQFSRVCLYFFSGADFLYADTFYPDCTTYILVSLEPVEPIPDLQSVPPVLLQNTLQTIEASLDTLDHYGYFQTRELREYSQRSQLKGVLPLLFVFLARSGKEILGVSNASLSGTRGAKVSFLDPTTGGQKVLYYFSADLSDAGLKSNSAVLRFSSSLGPTNSFLKASSYLLHGNGFDIARNHLLRVSASMLQDDSGIPIRYFTPGNWTLRFFGAYKGPIDLFKKFYQPDLRQYYAESLPKPLTFSFGYQLDWHITPLILATRK
jgi:hypothetical protein